MSGVIDISQLNSEIQDYSRVNNKKLMEHIYNAGELAQDSKTLTKVDGEFVAPHAVGGNVIKQFRAQHDPANGPVFKANLMKSYHQKADILITPSEIRGSYLSDVMYDEDKPLWQKNITRYIVDKWLPPLFENDLSYLEFKGAFNDGTFNFGDSMEGLINILTAGLTDVVQPMFRIPLVALTDDNIVDQVVLFEKNLPFKADRFIKEICMSQRNKKRHDLRYVEQYGTLNDYERSKGSRTHYGNRPIKGYHGANGSDLIWATVDGNFFQLIDKFKFPGFTHSEVHDRSLKLFYEFTLGYAYWIHQHVFVSDFGGVARGLVSGHTTYYPEESTTPIS